MILTNGIPGSAFRVGPFQLGRATLGATGLEWYQRAKTALAQFAALVAQIQTIANKTARESILEWVGSPNVDETPAYRYQAVLADVLYDVERYSPPNYGAYQLERRQRRVEELEGEVETLQEKVQSAIKVYGALPIPEPVKPGGTTTAIEKGADLTVPIVAIGSVIALAMLLS